MAEPLLQLTNRQIVNLHEGLAALDGVVDRAGQNTEITRFVFNDKLSWDIAVDSDIVERAITLFQKERKKKAAILGVVAGMKITPENAENVAQYQDEEETLMDQEQGLSGIVKLSRRELQTGNRIPPSVLKKIMCILTE